MTIVDPGVKCDRAYTVFREGESEGVFCGGGDRKPIEAPVWPGWAAFPDFTDSKVRRWWGRYYAHLLDQGAAGFWHDMNEPAAFAAWGDQTLPLPTRHTFDGRGGDHREAHNLYGLLMARAGFEALRTLAPDRRPFILSRSGWAGLQRFAWNWTGDVDSTWDALRQTVPTVLGLAISGICYTGPDVGGFGGTPSAELYLRWLQMAAFLPFFRTHSAVLTPRREPCEFGAEALAIAREVLRLRARLLPYFYTLAWDAGQRGWPLVRPLFWPDGRDPALWDIADEFYLGDALLVAPVLEEGMRAREVTLPPGTWHEWGSDRRHAGPGRVRIDAPLERIPVLVRGGRVLPLREGSRAQPRLVLHLYAPDTGDGEGLLYSDAGDGYDPGRVDRIMIRREGDRLQLTWTSEGPTPLPYTVVEIRVHGIGIRRAAVDGRPIQVVENGIETGTFATAVFEG
ncbi:MAG: hypothetical protein HY355_07145 [Armatimonadetes bacterium]|nr:hypothetical protein [Armatimonadota bacterium]